MTESHTYELRLGEPFDSRIDAAERHLETRDYSAARALYVECVAHADAMDDTPDVRLVRARMRACVAMVDAELGALDTALADYREAETLLRGIADTPMGPIGSQVWLDELLRALIGIGELLFRRGDLSDAEAVAADAFELATERRDDGTRAAEIADVRVRVAMGRGDWGEAERLARSVLATAEPTVGTIPDVLTNLGLVHAFTGRHDEALDDFAAAEEERLARGQTGPFPELLSHRGHVAMLRGDWDEAARLEEAASVEFERQGRLTDLAICEQSRSYIAMRKSNLEEAGELLASARARFEAVGAKIAAADAMLLAAQQAYQRGDVETMTTLGQQARAVFAESGAYDNCAEADYLAAICIEHSLDSGAFDGNEREAVDAGLALVLPAALALESIRYDFVSGRARNQWQAMARSAMDLAFRFAVKRQDPGLLFELVEFRCAGTPLAPDQHTVPVESAPPLADTAAKAHDRRDGSSALGSMTAGVAAGEGVRVAPPPGVVMSPGFDRIALAEYIDAAHERYRMRVIGDERVESW